MFTFLISFCICDGNYCLILTPPLQFNQDQPLYNKKHHQMPTNVCNDFFCFPYFAIMRGSRCAAKIPMKLSIYYNYFFYSKESSPPYSCALLDFEFAHVGNFLLSLCWYTFLKITFACLCSSWFFSFRSFILFKIFICLLQYINI